MIFKRTLALVFTAFLFSQSAFAAENKGFEQLRKTFSDVENFSVNFISKTNNIEGTAIYSKKFGEKISFGAYVILVKADTVFNYNKKSNRLLISPREDEYSDYSLRAILFELPERCEITEEAGAIKLTPRNPEEENFSELTIKTDEKGLPREIVITDLGGHKNEIELRGYKFNVELDAKNFGLPINSKTKIIDLR